MSSYKSSSYEQMEKQPKEKKFKQNSYEEIRKLVEDGENTNIVKDATAVALRGSRDIKNKKTNNNKEISYNFKLFD